MALNKDVCGTAVKDFVETLTPAQKLDVEYIWQGVLNVIFLHFQNNAVISTDVEVDIVSGDGTGTGTIE